ncbi:flagellar protein [Rhizobium sp. ARZ01]|uniref:flagellar protein n=1 Tax=Rhizobium sp. ARZ01 TaxID=2769313 RepID=UPI00178495DC|nr:flagellar protein [Rhizobium sp. ARZ01]MBD9373868.1 flagellar protein [Rhizobium sp. ARZ01]
MTDYDADKVVLPLKRQEEKTRNFGDRLLVTAGVTLAALAAFFPWYVFLNPKEFSVPPLWQGDRRDLPETPARDVMSVSPTAMIDEDDTDSADAVDPVKTATVPNLGNEKKTGATPEKSLDQPLPAPTGFRLMHVANGRALIEDASGLYIVRVGSILPDSSRLATLEQRDGEWVIVTSNGDVYKRN